MDFWGSISMGLVILASFLYARHQNLKRIKELNLAIVDLRKEMKRSFHLRYNFDLHKNTLDYIKDKKLVTTPDLVKHKYPNLWQNENKFRDLEKKENKLLNDLKKIGLLISMKGTTGNFKLSRISKSIYDFYDKPVDTFIKKEKDMSFPKNR